MFIQPAERQCLRNCRMLTANISAKSVIIFCGIRWAVCRNLMLSQEERRDAYLRQHIAYKRTTCWFTFLAKFWISPYFRCVIPTVFTSMCTVKNGFWMSQNTTKFLLGVIYLSWRHVSAPDLGHLQVIRVYIWGNYTVWVSGVPRNFVRGFNKFSRGQRTERTGIWGSSPLVRGSGASVIWYKKFHFI